MTSLLDIGPLTSNVKVRGVDIPINAITAEHVFSLINRFQTFRQMMEGDLGKVAPEELMRRLAPDCLAAIIVMCTGGVPEPSEGDIEKHGDRAKAFEKKSEALEAVAKSMTVVEVKNILAETFALTFGEEGVGPFVEDLRRILSKYAVQNGLAQVTNLQGELSAALQMDVPKFKSGKVHRAN